MLELASEISTWIVLAAAFGFGVGWFARGRHRRSTSQVRRRSR